jgi:hypothetical protein
MLRRLTSLVATLTLGLAPAGAAAAPRDVSATHAYLGANYAFLRAVHAREGTVAANVAKLNQGFAATCPRVGEGSPQNEESQHMSYEVAGALWATLYRTDANQVQAFLRAVRPLRWTNASITHIERSYATSLRELAALRMPDLCGDVRAWSAGGFKTVPASTLAFDRHVEAIEGKSIPQPLLARYEQGSDKGLAARAQHLETLLEHNETRIGFDDWDMLLETLALNQ